MTDARDKGKDQIADFDSASAMVRATAAYLHGRDLPMIGMLPRAIEPAARLYVAAVNSIPERLREQVYIWSGWAEALPADKADEIDVDSIAQWMVDEYPRQRSFPGVMLGSSNGALVHMCGALGIPMLPQTVLVPVRRGKVDPDDPQDDIARSMEPARAMLNRNPDVVLHHMHDPNQDRLMVQRMTYFRLKRTRLGPVYEKFLQERLEPGATIYLVECGQSWPTTLVQERHVFQFGAVGGATQEEFMSGGERVRDYLDRYGADRERWTPPEPDALRPEAEWGFEPELRQDVERFAREHGYRIQRIVFEEPEDTSPLVADFFREWHRERGIRDNRLLVESFVLMDPYLAMQTGSVPYWMVFNKEPSAENLERYLTEREPFDEINMMLFSHGVDSIGLPPIERWEAVLSKAREKGRFSGVNPEAYPRDFAVFVRSRDPLIQDVEERYPVPPPLPLERFESFLEERGKQSGVSLSEALPPPADDGV